MGQQLMGLCFRATTAWAAAHVLEFSCQYSLEYGSSIQLATSKPRHMSDLFGSGRVVLSSFSAKGGYHACNAESLEPSPRQHCHACSPSRATWTVSFPGFLYFSSRKSPT